MSKHIEMGNLLDVDWSELALQARFFCTVAELNARESLELLPEFLQCEKSLVAFENVIVTWDPGSSFIAWIRLIQLLKELFNVLAFDT